MGERMVRILLNDPAFPERVTTCFGKNSPRVLQVRGNLSLMARPSLGVLCSSRAPGPTVLQTYDLMQKLKLTDMVLIGGFHSPMERKCLEILVRGRAGIVLCPARDITSMRMPGLLRPAFEGGRVLIVSPFSGAGRRATVRIATERNRFVAALSDRLFVPHAAGGSKTEAVAAEAASWKREVVDCSGLEAMLKRLWQ